MKKYLATLVVALASCAVNPAYARSMNADYFHYKAFCGKAMFGVDFLPDDYMLAAL